ncbi:MAG: hypothetical protein KAY37_13055 [Phycisphaerae bacterium]|nr:hypothetical protein [Phycisphaerae bacterium]
MKKRYCSVAYDVMSSTRQAYVWLATIVVTFAAIGYAGGITYAADNLLLNPGFETGLIEPEGWLPVPLAPSGLNFVWDEGYAQSGTRSVCVEASGPFTGLWQQVMPVTPGVVYVLSGYVAFEDITPPGQCNLQLVFRDGANQIVSFINYPHHDGTREFALDFPPLLKVRAPADAATVEVNMYLQGPGRAWFDDIFFGPAATGTISGTVTCRGEPLSDVRVYLWGEPWDAVIEDFTDQYGHYELPFVPVTFPRYILLAEKPGYQTKPEGDIAVSEDSITAVDIELTPGPDPYDDLRVKCGRMELNLWSEPAAIPEDAVIPPVAGGYPEHIQLYLLPGELVESDHPAIIALATEIRASLPPDEQTDAVAVAYAVYEWVSKHIDHDGVFSDFPGGLFQPYRDVTSGIYQTISDEGWCWGRSFQDWQYRPSEALVVESAICVEHSALDSALLRALNIPARGASGSCEFWVQPPAGEGTWLNMSTSGGRTGYREHGLLGNGFADGGPPSCYPVTPRPVIHEDWNANNKMLWREKHPWGESYPGNSDGLAQALADLDQFALTGEAPHGSGSPPGGDRYQIHYSDVTLNLFNITPQRWLDVRFPQASPSATHIPLEHVKYWTNPPECVMDNWVEVITNPPALGQEIWCHIEFDLASLLGLGDMNCDGEVTWRDIDPFVLALDGADAYYSQYGNCNYNRADCNADGAVSWRDIDAFVELIGR